MSYTIKEICGFVKRNINVLASVVAMATLFYTGFADNNSLVDGNQVAKREFFAWAGVVVSIAALINIRKSQVRLNIIDLLAAAFTLLAVITFFANGAVAHTKLLVLVLIFALYMNLRLIFSADKRVINLTVILLMATGIIQAVIGLSQLFGGSFSNHYLYKVTGTFFNPGPYGGYLAVIASIALSVVVGLYHKVNTKPLIFDYRFFVFIFALTASFATFLLLPATMSRTAWFAFLFSCLIIVCGKIRVGKYIRAHKVSFFVTMFAVVILAIGAYVLKKESADGRLIMWRTGIEATLQKPLTGTATGLFAESFSQAQSRIFAQSAHYAYFVGSPEYGFNEFIQIAIEYGYLGLLLWGAAVLLALRNLFRADVFRKALGVGLFALLAFAFASYPFSILTFLIVLAVMLAAGASTDDSKGIRVGVFAKSVIVASVGLISVYGFVKIESGPYREWYSLQMIYQGKNYEMAIGGYDELYEKLDDNYKFLFEYGHVLGFMGRHAQAIESLKRGARMSCDPMFYNIIGNNYKALGQIDLAAQNYTKAHDILPSRIYPLYLLVKLYDENNRKAEAMAYALRVFDHKDKVSSPATRDIKNEVREIYERLSAE